MGVLDSWSVEVQLQCQCSARWVGRGRERQGSPRGAAEGGGATHTPGATMFNTKMMMCIGDETCEQKAVSLGRFGRRGRLTSRWTDWAIVMATVSTKITLFVIRHPAEYWIYPSPCAVLCSNSMSHVGPRTCGINYSARGFWPWWDYRPWA